MTPSETHERLVGAGRASAPDLPEAGARTTGLSLTINGERRTVPQDATIADVLRSLSLDPRTVVVERNREILRDRDTYATCQLNAGDELELVHFVGGG
jgi:sulfur carrier protein